ncbi:hypothetical protein ABFS83_12G019400 [Erythranthe nasuta]
MGAPKQRWTSEEESALKAGVQKHGVGKWSVILKDPEFNPVLRSRSNVDLKDKWRNLNCMVNGLGSRNRGNSANKNTQSAPKIDEGTAIENVVVEKESVALDAATPLAAINETIQDETIHDAKDGSSINHIPRLDELILEAITKLKEPRGSNCKSIASYIEDHHSAFPDLERDLAANLKILTANGQLVKVKRQYRIAPIPRSIASVVLKVKEPPLTQFESKKDLLEWERKGIVPLTKAQIDAELEKMKSMSAKEAVAAAAKALAEAEAAIALAEAAALEAEEAEAEAEAAHCFANAAQKTLNCNFVHA